MLAPPDESPAPNNRYINNKKQRADYRASCETMNLFKRKQRNSLLSTFIAVNSLTLFRHRQKRRLSAYTPQYYYSSEFHDIIKNFSVD